MTLEQEPGSWGLNSLVVLSLSFVTIFFVARVGENPRSEHLFTHCYQGLLTWSTLGGFKAFEKSMKLLRSQK